MSDANSDGPRYPEFKAAPFIKFLLEEFEEYAVRLKRSNVSEAIIGRNRSVIRDFLLAVDWEKLPNV